MAASAELALRLQGVRPALLDLRAPAMTLAGSASLQWSGLPWPDASTAAAAKQSLQARLALNGHFDARSALPVQIGALADAERNGAAWRIELRELQARSGEARVQASLAAQRGGDGGLALRSQGELSGFDPALWVPGAPDAAAWRQGPHRLAGAWRADLQSRGGAAPVGDLAAQLLAWRGAAELELRDSLLAGVPLHGQARFDGREPGWSVSAALQAGSNHLSCKGGWRRARATTTGASMSTPRRWRRCGPCSPCTAPGCRPSAATPPATHWPASSMLNGRRKGAGPRWPSTPTCARRRCKPARCAPSSCMPRGRPGPVSMPHWRCSSTPSTPASVPGPSTCCSCGSTAAWPSIA